MARTKSVSKASTPASADSSRYATPEPIKGSRRKTTRSSRLTNAFEAADFDSVDADESTSAGPSSFRGVFLPTMTSTTRSSRRTSKMVVSDSTGSGPSSIADSSETMDFETPVTSALTTPAAENPYAKAKVAASARALELRTSGTGTRSVSLKRKIKDESDQEDADAKMAARMQAEEYGIIYDSDDDVPVPKRSRASYQSPYNLSDSEVDFEDMSPPASAARKIRGHPISAVACPRRNLPKIESIGSSEPVSALSSALTSAQTSEYEEDQASEAESEEGDDDDVVIVSASAPPAAPPTLPVSPPRRSRRRGRRDQSDRHLLPGERRAQRERKKLERAHPEIKTMWVDLKNIQPIRPQVGDQPSTITRKLKSFQLEGVDWMKKQEQSVWKGGLLGDEMGMGKTIQAVSLIMSDYPAKAPTLVVVPPVALMQWQSEIKAYTDGKLSVLIYHVSANPKCKTMTTKDLKKFNIIMVSYSGLESMYRKESKGWNRQDGIVKEDSVLHAIKYHRLILDEAHSIKQRTTGVAKACFALKADYKWCLSGTPVQNRIGEFFSLLRFLELVPFACYFCKQCKCSELHWSQDENKMCTKCKHSGFNHVSVFNQEILNPITQGEDSTKRKEGLDKLRLITDRIMLRRMKRDHTSSMELPPKDVVIHNEFFGEIERDFSQSIMSNSTRKFDTYVSQGVMLNNYANIFGLIMQMRQVANHPDLILRKNAEGGQNVIVCRLCDEPAEEAIRSRCHHEFCRQCAKNYIRAFDGKESDAECPQCHIPLVIDWDQPEIEQDEDNVKKSSIINRIKMEDWTSSTKIETLLYELWQLRSTKTTAKSIVFSQFTSMLQLVQWRLQKSGFTTVLLDGSMSPSQRQKSIDYFMNNVNVEVFLVSLKAGGVALNLTEASKVFIVDPWWNPAAEWQSADRCHRIGQKRPCKITRLCIEDSVESRMVLLQEKKANMINGTVNNDQVALDKLTPEDMQFLFRGS